uniref:Knl1 C-terminal RWD domain-containing protein n=1 Tax=Paramormyrops kingsleyae TaxID=1676925 RepID=A0A3B3RGV0_9TELE
MDTAEAARNRNNPSKPGSRRISSILKAPRTPLKSVDVDNEDCQDEPTEPVEKKRKSRRVSFATTNDIKYISDTKNSSPGMGLCEDLDITGTEQQNERIYGTNNTVQQIVGMETLLNAPLHVSHQHNKENMFYMDYQDGNSDKTILFSGEDTACMEMTHCHTVIDNDAVDFNKTVPSSEIIAFASEEKREKNSNYENLCKPGNSFKGPDTSVGAQITESDMDDFLASLTEIAGNSCPGTSSQGPKTTTMGTSFIQCSDSAVCPKVNTKAFLSSLSSYRLGADKVNQAPCITKMASKNDVMSTTTFPTPKHSLQLNERIVTEADGDDMDLTKNQAVLMDGKDLWVQEQSTNQENLKVTNEFMGSDDMEMTRNHTVLIDSQKMHGMLNPPLSSSRRSICSTTAKDKTIIFSEDDYGMEMTAALTTPIEEINHPAISGKPKVKPGSCVFGDIGMTSYQTDTISPNVLAAEPSDSDDMEITRSQTVFTHSKTCGVGQANPSLASSRKSICSTTASDKTIIFSGDDYGMDMTAALTTPIEEINHPAMSEQKKVFKSPKVKPGSYVFADIGMTSHLTDAINPNVLAAEPSDSDDMEITRSQTVFTHSKTCGVGHANPSLATGRRSLSYMPTNKTVIFSDDDFGMEMTTALTMPIEENHPPVITNKEMNRQIPPTKSVVHYEQTNMTGPSSNQNGPGRQSWSHVPVNKIEDDCGMEMTTALIVPVEEHTLVPTSEGKAAISFPSTNCIGESGQVDGMEMTRNQMGSVSQNVLAAEHFDSDMEITRSQTVAIDSKTCSVGMANTFHATRRKSFSCMPANGTIMFSDEDVGMEMTTAIAAPIEENHSPVITNNMCEEIPLAKSAHLYEQANNLQPTNSQKVPGNRTGSAASGSFDADDMKITKSQTFDSKSCAVGMAYPSSPIRRKSITCRPTDKTVMFSEDDFDMEMTTAHTVPFEESRHVLTNAGKASFRFPGKTSTAHSGPSHHMELLSDQTGSVSHSLFTTEPSNSDDVDVTRVQTVVDYKTPGFGMANSLCLTGRKSLSYMPVNKTLSSEVDIRSDGEMTTALGMPIKESSHCNLTKACRETAKISSDESDGTRMVNQSTSNDEILSLTSPAFVSDMRMKSDEALGAASDTSKGAPPQDITVFAEENYNGMEMTTAFTVEIDENAYIKETATVPCFDLPNTGMTSSQTEYSGPCNNEVAKQGIQTTVSNSDIHLNVGKIAVTVAKGNTLKENERNLASMDQSSFPEHTVMHSELKDNCNKNNVFVMDCTDTTCKESDDLVHKRDSVFTVHPLLNQNEKKSVRASKKISRRMSLTDLQSKLNTMRDIIIEPVDTANGCLTAPVPQLSSEVKDSVSESRNCPSNEDCKNYQPALHSPLNISKEDENDQWKDGFVCTTQTNMTAPIPFLKSKPKIGRMSFGGFLPKLPQKNKSLSKNFPEITKGGHLESLLTKRVSHGAFHHSSSGPVENIDDEMLPEISSEEDLSETIEGRGHASSRIQEDASKGELGQDAVDEPLVEAPIQNVAQGLKRSSPMDGHEERTEERKTKKNLDSEGSSKFTSQLNRNVADAAEENPSSTTVKTLDTTNSSNNSTYLRAEGTFDTSAQRCSQFETDFDEATGYEIDLQKKLDDGSITVKEFLNFFGIDFVIHKPRQSVLPDNFALAHEPQDLLMEKYVNRPKQQVYEDDNQELSKIVEKLKTRMWDQNKPLKMINQSFWEVVKTYSDEQLQRLRSKLRERKVYFRKKSKGFSHEMKIGLYSSLVQTTQLAQQNLTEKINEADEFLKNLDDCLQDLQAELDLMDEEGLEEVGANSELMHTLEVKQQELESLNVAVTENERGISFLVMEKNSIEDKICRIQEETKEFEKNITVLDRVIEWKLSEESESRALYTFLNGSVELEVLFESCANTTGQTDQKVNDIRFHLQLDEENSMCYARLVHKLISQFIKSESNWMEKYPTRPNIPLLLHNVALVVSRCRVLGEEIHQLWKWGSLKFDVLQIGCQETQISILFSSLKAFAKFEVTLAIDPAYPASHLEVLTFKNYIGNTRLEQLEEIVSTVTPARNYLTRIVKRIHDVILH